MLYVPRSSYRPRLFSPFGYCVIFGLGFIAGPPILWALIRGFFWSIAALGQMIGQ